jgi:hypothetical protein
MLHGLDGQQKKGVRKDKVRIRRQHGVEIEKSKRECGMQKANDVRDASWVSMVCSAVYSNLHITAFAIPNHHQCGSY